VERRKACVVYCLSLMIDGLCMVLDGSGSGYGVRTTMAYARAWTSLIGDD
jgi:hypothetical protein